MTIPAWLHRQIELAQRRSREMNPLNRAVIERKYAIGAPQSGRL